MTVIENPKNTPKEKHKLNHIPQSGASRNNVEWDRKKAFTRTAANGQLCREGQRSWRKSVLKGRNGKCLKAIIARKTEEKKERR